MKKTLLYLLCATVVLSSCKKDDNDDDDAGGGAGSTAMRIASISGEEDGSQTYEARLTYEADKLTDQLDYYYEGGSQPNDSSLTMVEYSGNDITISHYEGESGAWQLDDSEIRTISGGKLLSTQYYAEGTTGSLSSQRDFIYSGDRLTQQIYTDYSGGSESEIVYDYVYINDRLDVREQRNSNGDLTFRTRIIYTGSIATSTYSEYQNAGDWQTLNRTDIEYANGLVSESREYFYDFLTQEPELSSIQNYLYNGAGQVVTTTYTDPDDNSVETNTINYESGSSNISNIYGDPENGLVRFGPDIF